MMFLRIILFITMLTAITSPIIANDGVGKKVIEIDGPARISDKQTWSNCHYKVKGSITIEKGGELTIEDCTVELIGSYSREFVYRIEEGKLVTRRSTIGGTKTVSGICQSVVEIEGGEWDAFDTTVQYSYGITFGWTKAGKLKAVNLNAGPNADSVIMSGFADVYLKDSSFGISLMANSAAGGECSLDLTQDKPLDRLYCSKNMPGVAYRLEMINTKVNTWWLFVYGVSQNGPDFRVKLSNCTWIVPSICAYDLKGIIKLPMEIQNPVKTANVTWEAVDNKPAKVACWGVYCTGGSNDVTFLGPTTITELITGGGTVRILGTEGTRDARVTATTIEAGQWADQNKSELIIKNAKIGWYAWAPNLPIVGQITSYNNTKVSISESDMDALILMTKGSGTINLKSIKKEGNIRKLPDGGPITTDMD